MIIPYDQIDGSLVGKVVVQLSHIGENWYEREQADQVSDRLPVTAVINEGDHVRLLFGQLRYLSENGRVLSDTMSADAAPVAADLEQGIGSGGWVEVIDQ